MIINQQIITILDANKINRDDALTYLIALYNKLNPSYIPEPLKRQIYANGILNRGETEGSIVWLVPLFEEKKSEEKNWDWVLDKYRVLFTMIRGDAGGDKKSCIDKMKLYLRNNPEVTQDEVLAAASQYTEQFKSGRQNIQYLQRADYFILKIQNGAGGRTHESRLGEYIEIVRKLRKTEELQNKNVLR
jgi:hypothetical protein